MLRLMPLVLASAFSFACAAPNPESGSSVERSDEAAACAADEAILSCIVEQCPDLVDDAFDDCFTDNCEEGHDDTPLSCALCVVDGFEGGQDAAGIVSSCSAPAAPSQAACATDEAILSCITTECPVLYDTEFDDCFTDNCEEGHDDTPLACGLCVVDGFEAGLDAGQIEATCTQSNASTAATAACAAADLDLFACLAASCPDADTTETIGQCVADSCFGEAEVVAMSCMVCIGAQLDEGASAVGSLEERCTADGSAPCDPNLAAAMQDCAELQCGGMQGDALDECMDMECPEVFDDVSEECGQCIIGLNQNGVPFGDASADCAGRRLL